MPPRPAAVVSRAPEPVVQKIEFEDEIEDEFEEALEEEIAAEPPSMAVVEEEEILVVEQEDVPSSEDAPAARGDRRDRDRASLQRQ